MGYSCLHSSIILFYLSTAPPHVSDADVLCGRVRKKSGEEGASFSLTTSSPSCSDRAPSASSDSGLSVASQGLTGARLTRGATQDKRSQAGKPVSEVDCELSQYLQEVMTELTSSGGRKEEITGGESGLGHTINGEALTSERETDILDDEEEVDNVAVPALDMPSSLSSENLPKAQNRTSAKCLTHSWVQQQQKVGVSDNFIKVDGDGNSNRMKKGRPPPLVVSVAAPDTPPRGLSSKEAVQRGLLNEDDAHIIDKAQNIQSANTTQISSCQEDELESLSTEIDESIEQLNQLILDLDPTFVPVPTRCSPLSRTTSLHTNGLSHKGSTYQSGKTN